MRLLRLMIGAQLTAWLTVDLDARVLAFTLGASLLAGLISALAPALELFRKGDVGASLKQGGRGSSTGRGAGRLRDAIVVGEITFAVILVAGTALMVRVFPIAGPGQRLPHRSDFHCF